ncbi:hypothetical protein, partial [Acinetobacter terrae]|uniref:hypothetical protein n=1 Tax=Acinetobacter terrae TaxID=2731247 RepID=UPI001BC89658
NSIESRFRSIRRGNFWVNISVTLRKSKSKIKSSSEFASLISFLLAALGLESNLESSHPCGMLCHAGD